jgi:hypothetical protein
MTEKDRLSKTKTFEPKAGATGRVSMQWYDGRTYGPCTPKSEHGNWCEELQSGALKWDNGGLTHTIRNASLAYFHFIDYKHKGPADIRYTTLLQFLPH